MDTWILITNGTVVDGAGNPPSPETSVLVRGNRIAAVGRDVDAASVPRGETLTTVDAAGKTVMPGMIDGHCHISFGNTHAQEEQDFYTGVELRTLRSAWNVKRVLRAGVTGFSNPGGSYFIGVGIREGIREGIVRGPRMTSAGRFITTSNGIADFYPTWVDLPESSIGVLANTKDEMIAELRRQVKGGVDLIKLADSPFGDFQAFTNDEVKTLADLAHQHRKRITMHARGSAEVGAAVEAGLDWIMHGNSMTDEVIDALAASGIPLVPTLTLLANFADFGGLAGTAVEVRHGCARMLETTAETLHKAQAAGVKFVTGSDAGFAVTPYGEWHARELELLMAYTGMSSLEAIQSATSNAAIVLNLEGHVGQVAEGMLADLLVVDGDPVNDIRVLQDKRRIEVVIKDGVIQEFADDELVPRPYDRGIVYSSADLTWDVVYGDGPEAPRPGDRLSAEWAPEEGRELAAQLKQRERAAAATGA